MTMANPGKADSTLTTGISTLIGLGMQVRGDIECKGTLRVQGSIQGNVHCDKNDGDALVVDSLGTVNGAVSATHVCVRGRITGPVSSKQQVEVHEGAAIVGDISFRTLAIHAGGVVDGQLMPSPVTAPAGDQPVDVAADDASDVAVFSPATEKGFKGRWIGIAIASLAIGAAAGTWLAYDDAGDVPAENVVPPVASAPPDAPQEAHSEPKSEAESVPDIGPAAPPEPAKPSGNGQDGVVTVRGINPERPAGVFLLISNEDAILHKKKQDDPGEGAQTGISQGEKVSIAVAPDELIRISKGRDVTIYFQGQKVPRRAIENEAWIRLVPK